MDVYLWGFSTIALFVAAVPIRDAWRRARRRARQHADYIQREATRALAHNVEQRRGA